MPLVGELSEQQKNVYNAQSGITFRNFDTYDEVQAWVDSLTASDWWTNAGYDFIVRIEVEKSTTHKCSYAVNRQDDNYGIIALTEDSKNACVILHEVAHCIVPDRYGHGEQWVRIFLNLVYFALGSDEYLTLYKAFKSHNVEMG